MISRRKKNVRKIASLVIPIIMAIGLWGFWQAILLTTAVAVVQADNGDGVILEPGQIQFADPGQTITYTHKITATGDISGVFAIELSGSSGFTADLISNSAIHLPTAGTDTITFTVTVSDSVMPGSQGTATLTATLQADPYIFATVVNNTIIRSVSVGPDNSDSGIPGQVLTYTHWLTNTGNITDTFDIALTSSENFTVTLLSATPITIAVGMSEPITLTVRIPDDAEAWLTDVTTVMVTSQDNGSSDWATNTTVVETDYSVAVGPDNSDSGIPGQVLTYTHWLTNTGNITDTFDIALTSSENFTVTLLSATPIAVAARMSEPITLTVRIPDGAEAWLTDETTVTVTSQDNGSSDWATNTTTVNVIADIDLSPTVSVINANPGETVVHSYTITNMGNAPDSFAIQPISTGFPVTVSHAAITLTQGSSAAFHLSVMVPPDSPSGTIDIAHVIISSTNDNAITRTAEARTQVDLWADFQIDPALQPIQTVPPSRSAIYTHIITNLGNAADTLAITYTSGFPASLSAASLQLDPNDSGTITVAVTVPNSVSSGAMDNVIITVTSENVPTVTRSVTNTTIAGQHLLYLPIALKPTEWQLMGAPTGASFLSIAACSTGGAEPIIFAGSQEDLLRWDAGSWVKVEGIPSDRVTGIVFNQACDKVYAGIYNKGVWHGNTNGTAWTRLGADIDQTRALVRSGDNLFAGGDFGVRYWNLNGGTAWLTVTGIEGSISQPVMHLSVADPVNQSGPVYAVRWFDGRIYANLDPAAAPANWASLAIPNSTDMQMRAVFRDNSGALHIGTTAAHYRFDGNEWPLVRATGARSFTRNGNIVYAGYTDSAGVYASVDGVNFSPFNAGWPSPQQPAPSPETIFALFVHNQTLYAATSGGVWRHKLP